jgi:hypothetical protein
MNRKLAFVALMGLIVSNDSICLAQRSQRGSEQRVFGAEAESFKHPFPLPEAILEILSHDREIPETIDEKETPGAKLVPNSWFFASAVHLADSDEKDVVVMGRCPLCGANVVPFWVFRPTADGYEQVMFGRGLALEVMRHRTNGYSDIETSLVSQRKPWTGTWRFNGHKYVLTPDTKNHSAPPD